MDLKTIVIDYIKGNYMLFIVALILICLACYKWYQHHKSKKVKEAEKSKTMETQKYPGYTPSPVPTFEDISFERDFMQADSLPRNNYNNLVHQREMLDSKIRDSIKLYYDSKDKKEKLLIMAKKLAEEIPLMKEQLTKLNEQINKYGGQNE